MVAPDTEWIETDGLGGYAMGTVSGLRTRRYHALLCVAAAPPTDRRTLVNGLDLELTTPAGVFNLSPQNYAPDVLIPGGQAWLREFSHDPWPTWRFELPDGLRLTQELFVTRGQARTVLRWRLEAPAPGVSLAVRPFLSNRDHHALHAENPAFHFRATEVNGWRVIQPYAGAPAIAWLANARFDDERLWYRHFLYREEQARGLDCVEDLAMPGVLTYDLSAGEGALVLATAADPAASAALAHARARARGARQRRPARGGGQGATTARAADAYVVARGSGATIIAGYPWFTDWGRDTFISMRGLCLAQGRLDEALGILRAWAATVDHGMVPNRFPDRGAAPEFNAVDASLWFVIVVGELTAALTRARRPLSKPDAELLRGAALEILRGYRTGTRHGIHVAADGLVAAGEPGVQLTWMDAKVGDQVITPRIGKPVEIQALWINALAVGIPFDERLKPLERLARERFLARFPLPNGQLKDVIDVDHVDGRDDPSMRPNQIFAVGGLPRFLLSGAQARAVVEAVETELLTPWGLRTLARADTRYQPRYAGDVRARDGAYHQGTVWPWLMGPFLEALLRVHGRAKASARIPELLSQLRTHARTTGGGHLPEIADGDAPHTPNGCPFQAWSLAELLRIEAALKVG